LHIKRLAFSIILGMPARLSGTRARHLRRPIV